MRTYLTAMDACQYSKNVSIKGVGIEERDQVLGPSTNCLVEAFFRQHFIVMPEGRISGFFPSYESS